jgi:hypothetical protein
LLFVLINIVFYVLEGSFLAHGLYNLVLKEDDIQLFTRLPVLSLVGFMSIFILSIVFIFGILPNYVHNIQQRQNHLVNKTPKENLKIAFILGCGLFLVMVLLSEDGDLPFYVPLFLRLSALGILFLFAAIFSTLSTLRFYFSKNKFYLLSGVCFVCLSSFLYIYAKGDISSENLHVKNKIDSIGFIGLHLQDLDKEIEKDFLAAGPSLATLTQADISEFFKAHNRMDMASKVLLRWDDICLKDKNFTCRLAYGIRRINKLEPKSLEMLKQSCPNDLASCHLVYFL